MQEKERERERRSSTPLRLTPFWVLSVECFLSSSFLKSNFLTGQEKAHGLVHCAIGSDRPDRLYGSPLSFDSTFTNLLCTTKRYTDKHNTYLQKEKKESLHGIINCPSPSSSYYYSSSFLLPRHATPLRSGRKTSALNPSQALPPALSCASPFVWRRIHAGQAIRIDTERMRFDTHPLRS